MPIDMEKVAAEQAKLGDMNWESLQSLSRALATQEDELRIKKRAVREQIIVVEARPPAAVEEQEEDASA